jgi:hypothetical protein
VAVAAAVTVAAQGCTGLYYTLTLIKSNQTVTLVIVVVMVMGGEICEEHGSGWGVE